MVLKKYFFALIFVQIASISFSQTIHIRIGPSLSTLFCSNTITSNIQSNKSILGFNGFVGVDYLNLKYFSLSSNIGYVQKGGNDSIIGTTTNSPEGGSYFIKTKLGYFSVNTTADFKLPIKHVIVLFIHFGPRLDVLVYHNRTHNDLVYLDENKGLNNFSYGLLLGGGLNVTIKKIQVGVIFDYYLNINDISKMSLPETTLKKVWDKTFTLNLQLGYNL